MWEGQVWTLWIVNFFCGLLFLQFFSVPMRVILLVVIIHRSECYLWKSNRQIAAKKQLGTWKGFTCTTCWGHNLTFMWKTLPCHKYGIHKIILYCTFRSLRVIPHKVVSYLSHYQLHTQQHPKVLARPQTRKNLMESIF